MVLKNFDFFFSTGDLHKKVIKKNPQGGVKLSGPSPIRVNAGRVL